MKLIVTKQNENKMYMHKIKEKICIQYKYMTE